MKNRQPVSKTKCMHTGGTEKLGYGIYCKDCKVRVAMVGEQTAQEETADRVAEMARATGSSSEEVKTIRDIALKTLRKEK